MKPENDQTVMVFWLDQSIGRWSGPFLAYYEKESDSFFPLFGDSGFPLKIDGWMKVPPLSYMHRLEK